MTTERASILRITLPDQVAGRLRQRILRGELKEGLQLRQDAIAAEYGVSRMPVREAFRQLEAEGLIVFYPHRGAVVSSLSLENIDEIFGLRALIECDVLRAAIRNMTSTHLSRAAELVQDFGAAIERREPQPWGEMNWQFHRALYEAANRPLTLELLRKLHQSADRYLRLHMTLTSGAERAMRDHEKLIALCTAKEEEKAVRFLRRHILDAGRDLSAGIIQGRDPANTSDAARPPAG